MWKETPPSSGTTPSSPREPENTKPSREAAAVPEIVLPGADPAATLPVESVIASTPGGSIADASQYKVVMSCHVEQGDPPPLAGRETAGPIPEWIRSTGGKRGNR